MHFFQTTKIDEDMLAKTGTEKDPKVENEINCTRREQEGKEEAKESASQSARTSKAGYNSGIHGRAG